MKRIFSPAALTVLLTAVASPVHAACNDSDPYYWQGDRRLPIYDQLVPMMTCAKYEDDEQALSDQSACNWFVGRGLLTAYGISEFTPQGGGWKSANQIASYVESSTDWALIGEAGSQDALNAAAQAAKEGAAVIAVQRGSPHGHIAFVLAGPLVASGSWHLQVPNSASLFLDRPLDSYVGCKLSYAFQQPSGVKLYQHR